MKQKYQFTLLCAAVLSSSAQAAVIAQFNSFEHNNGAAKVAEDNSAQTSWVTSDLIDHATGSGALGSSNRNQNNRGARTLLDTTSVISFSSNRESDAGVPNGPVGKSTWLIFSIEATTGGQFDFSGQSATADTFARGAGSGTTSADWTLYYSSDGTAWTSLGTVAGASKGGGAGVEHESVSWDLSAIGTQTEIHFLLDPQSTGGTNGSEGQRGIAVGNIEINANVIPEPSTLALLGFVAAFGFRRRRA